MEEKKAAKGKSYKKGKHKIERHKYIKSREKKVSKKMYTYVSTHTEFMPS